MNAEEEIDLLISRRNDLQFQAENINEVTAEKCWTLLGVANRHIERLVGKTLPFSNSIKFEVEKCFERCVSEMGWKR